MAVSGEFFHLLCDETCARWLAHLEDVSTDPRDQREHTSELPAWIARLPGLVHRGKESKLQRDAAARVAAAVLGIGVRSVYRGVSRRGQH